MKKEKLRVTHLRKQKRSGLVLEDVNLNVYDGEVLGVLGLHDAGKSTLLDVVAGRASYDGGVIFLDEERMPSERIPENGRVSLVGRRSALVGSLTVAENIFVVRPHKHAKFLLRHSVIEQQTRKQFEALHIEIDPHERVDHLTDIEGYLVELVKAYILGVRLILVDDFTEEYPIDDYAVIGRVIEQLKRLGVSFMVTGSQWSCLAVFCDRIAVLDRRCIAKILAPSPENRAVAERILLGGDEEHWPRPSRTLGQNAPAAFEMRHVSGVFLSDLSLTVHAGEVVALYDPHKRAVQELYELLNKLSRPHTGMLTSFGQPYRPDLVGSRVAITDFNLERRYLSRLSLRDNLCLPYYRRMAQWGVLREKRIRFIEQEFERWYGDAHLSGLERCTGMNEHEKMAVSLFTLQMLSPRLIVCADPNTVADYVSGQMIYQTLHHLAAEGTAVLLLISSVDWDWSIADHVYPIPPYSVNN